MKRFLRYFALLLAVLTFGTVVSACGNNSTPVSYAPAAYGQRVNGVFECYFIDDISEVAALEQAGLCPVGSEPTVMPLVWQQTYWAYYSSPAYYNVYIPVGYRSHYISYTTVFSRRYSSQINTYAGKATYKGSNGSTVKGGTSSLKFSSGGGSSSVHGGGARGCAESLTVVHMRGGGGSSSGGSHGGGSRGSSGSGSGSGSRSGSGC